MNQNNPNMMFGDNTMIPNQSTYPPYIDIPGYQNINSVTNSALNTNLERVDAEYADEVFSRNHGKMITVYLSYPDSIEWRDRMFKGKIIANGKDYLLLEQEDGKNVLLWLTYINYAEFNEAASY